ncbi:MAG: hypothetical protein P9M08_06545 [Candidatus Erginobacter occultus]|nr:hypothetical protein [Candidatus Erginobacter occultus]
MTTGKSLGLLFSFFAAAAIIAYLAVRQDQSTGESVRDLSQGAQRAVIQANTGRVQAAVNIYYAKKAIEGKAVFPPAITADMFDDGQIPPSAAGQYYWEYDSTTGTVTNNIAARP